MKSALMAALLKEGLLQKKDDILCCHDHDYVMANWLHQQQFKYYAATETHVPGANKNKFAASKKIPPLFDVVLYPLGLEQEQAGEAAATELQDAYERLKPGGRFIVLTRRDDLFAAVHDGASMVRSALDTMTVDAITTVAHHADDSTDIVVVKKGGVYKPQLKVRHIDDETAFREACEQLHGAHEIGLDVETTLAEPRILCTVQLAAEDTVYVIDALPLEDLTPLKHLLEDERILKIIHNKAFEEQVLGQYGIRINNIYDTLIASRKRSKTQSRRGHNLRDVCARELGIFLDKSLQASDWTVRPLSVAQRDYAAADAEVLLYLYRRFEPPKPPETMSLF